MDRWCNVMGVVGGDMDWLIVLFDVDIGEGVGWVQNDPPYKLIMVADESTVKTSWTSLHIPTYSSKPVGRGALAQVALAETKNVSE
ncbi:hypothetical protein Tco_0584245 [Tanacetum coccineum]